ncbi:hypothetical protein [Aneurinibacillus tyrosinisolvens]|uniref:hypothetical protein n=1 Tax=Aneurinibacillus tyrosinisolvens TaxID=1443435 RepID=UPI00063EF451|nr:hypothetical protein [Aneurinibacillus tyrosinisolvens]
MQWKRFAFHFVYLVVIILVVFQGLKFDDLLDQRARETMDRDTLYWIYFTLFPILNGLLLKIGGLVIKAKRKGKWRIDWIKVIVIGIPMLYITLIPMLSFTLFLGINLPFSGYIMTIGGGKLTFISGTIVGYVLLDSLYKELITTEIQENHITN